jgi:hypothetical protein
VGRALAGDWPAEPGQAGELLELVCRPSLDLHLGTSGRHGERLGNLRADDPQVMLARALDRAGRPPDAPWFGPGPPPPVAELAARRGERAGRGVHFSADSVGRRWLDRARAPRGGAG